MDLLEPRYDQANQVRLEDLRSRVNVARALLAARVSHGLTQAELGKAAGTKQSRVSEIEAMKGNPRFDTLDRVSREVGLMVALVPRGRHLGSLDVRQYQSVVQAQSTECRVTTVHSHSRKWASAAALMVKENARG